MTVATKAARRGLTGPKKFLDATRVGGSKNKDSDEDRGPQGLASHTFAKNRPCAREAGQVRIASKWVPFYKRT